jgi:O-antigen/teichoic acid export membrane protein
MCGTAVLFFSLTWAPVLTLGVTSSVDQVAYFTAAARIATFVALIPSIQSSYLAPQFAALFHQSRLDELNTLTRRSTTQAVVVGALATSVVLLIPGRLLQLFGTSFNEAVTPLRVLCLAAIAVATQGQVTQLMVNCGLEKTAATIGSAVLLSGTFAMYVAGSRSGADGVALASGLSMIGYATISAMALRSRVGIVAGLGRGPIHRSIANPSRTSLALIEDSE